MPNWFFRWMRLPNRDLKVTILRQSFSAPDASKDVCQAPKCGITREHHVKLDHPFKES